MRSDRASSGNVPVNSALPRTVPDPFLIRAMRPLTRVSRERNSQVFFPERIRLIQGSLMIKPFNIAPGPEFEPYYLVASPRVMRPAPGLVHLPSLPWPAAHRADDGEQRFYRKFKR